MTKEKNEHFRHIFTRAQKKDDYSDSLLQGQAFAHVVKHIEADASKAGKIIKPRPFPKPRPPKEGEKKITKAHIAYFLQACTTVDEIEKELSEKKKVKNALTTLFGSAQAFLASRVIYTKKLEQKQKKPVTDQLKGNVNGDTEKEPCLSPIQPYKG